MRHEIIRFHDVDALGRAYSGLGARDVLEECIYGGRFGKLALVSSFGAESAVLLHMISRIDPAFPVLVLDTEFFFEETKDYIKALSAHLGLSGVRRIKPNAREIALFDPDGDLHLKNKDRCCYLRKVLPLERALRGFDGWISGRKRFQNGARSDLALFEHDASSAKLKINPLHDWTREDLLEYMAAHDLPRHPLVARNFLSIGCAPCTSPVKAGDEPRAGRWRGEEKTECGMHF